MANSVIYAKIKDKTKIYACWVLWPLLLKIYVPMQKRAKKLCLSLARVDMQFTFLAWLAFSINTP